MSSKQKKTLQILYQDPVRSDITWDRIENLLKALGAEISEGRGARIRVALNGIRMVFHRPHPKNEMDKGAVKSVRRFLNTAGVKP